MASATTSTSRRTGSPAGRELRPRTRIVCWVLFVATLIAVGIIVLTPGPPAAAAQQSLGLAVDRGHGDGSVPAAVTTGRIEWTANVVMFLPIGFFLAGAVRRGLRIWVIPFATLLSAAIELAQLLWLPSRVASWWDVLANGTGAAVGVAILVVATRMRRRSAA